jgi:hypothetical protein
MDEWNGILFFQNVSFRLQRSVCYVAVVYVIDLDFLSTQKYVSFFMGFVNEKIEVNGLLEQNRVIFVSFLPRTLSFGLYISACGWVYIGLNELLND